METQRTITMLLPNDDDLRATLAAFRKGQNTVTATAFHDGKPLRAIALQRVVYAEMKGHLSSQMTITALRLVAGAYACFCQAQLRATGSRGGQAQGSLCGQ